ncbi:hypothetical protein [Paenibacillus sp. GCM10028914]|uniref:hypothetical protein n=1 Tax=Paenibacillus sp. GCM10028914 TaxID=3273416 RepID=UPI0036181AC1
MKIFKPFNIIPKIKGLLIIWTIFIIIFGQLGIWAILISDSSRFFTANIVTGNFYTFSIALLASSVLTFAIELMNFEEIKFKMLKIISLSISFLLVSIMMLLFISLPENPSFAQIFFQIFLYLISLISSIYFLCLQHLHIDYDNYTELDDKSINTLLYRASQNVETDGRGAKL